MKKLVHIILLIGVVFFLQNCSSDYKKAEEFADAGNYKAFYNGISRDVNSGDPKAKNLLINYCFKAIQDGDLKQVQYFMQEQPQLINSIDDEGNRAIDVVLFDEMINIKILKLLLKYNPELNYIVHYYDMTPLQVIVSGKYENLEALKLLLENGADPDYVGKSNRSKSTPLLYSYVRDKINTFRLLLKYKANYEIAPNNIYDAITSSYALYLQNHGIDLKSFYNSKLSSKAVSIFNSSGYRTIHNKNMQYLTLLQKYRKVAKKNSCAPRKLMKWYIKTKANNALKLLMQHQICNKVLLEMKEFAMQLNNRAALYILDENVKGK
jgi:hypothetical protein